jgi:hypothetical protein
LTFCLVVLQRDDIDQTTQPVKLNTIELTLEVGTGQFMNPEIFIAGGGPAGLVTAIVAARSGRSVVVSDTGHPPIDNACGESFARCARSASLPRCRPLLCPKLPLHGIRFSVSAPIARPHFLMTSASASGAPFFTLSFSVMLKQPVSASLEHNLPWHPGKLRCCD